MEKSHLIYPRGTFSLKQLPVFFLGRVSARRRAFFSFFVHGVFTGASGAARRSTGAAQNSGAPRRLSDGAERGIMRRIADDAGTQSPGAPFPARRRW